MPDDINREPPKGLSLLELEKQMNILKYLIIASALAVSTLNANATVIDQYATSVVGFSSQWSSGGWSAAQTLGAPNTSVYGDIPTSWAPQLRNGGNQFISVGFNTPVFSTGATIRETYGNGFVYQIDVIDLSSAFHTVWSGIDNSAPGTPVDFLATWATTGFLVNGLKVYVNTEHNQSAWEEIDSIQLHGNSVAQSVSAPSIAWVLGLGLLGLIGMRHKSSVLPFKQCRY